MDILHLAAPCRNVPVTSTLGTRMRLLASILGLLLLAGCSLPVRKQYVLSDELKERGVAAKTLFDEACKRSGEFIHRTVPNVRALLILKLRPATFSPYDQYAVDPYGYDFDWSYRDKPPPYISTFLVGKDARGLYRETGEIVAKGYDYVEALDPADGKRYRYTGQVEATRQKDPDSPNNRINRARDPNWDINIYDFVVRKSLADGPAPRYGVTYDDISTREERAYWIAGSSLKVVDLQTNEVLAERIGYMVDFAQGATPGGRQPWTFARKNHGWSCPALNLRNYGARTFVEKVLLLPRE